jgi:phage antirepressor YoqD-like protein
MMQGVAWQGEEIRFGKIQGTHGGKPYYVLNEAQVTAVKMNLRKNLEVAAMPKTALEKKLIVAQAMQYLQEEIEELRARNAEMKPKAEYFDALVDAKGLTNFRDTTKEIGIPEKQFIAVLIEKGYIYRDANGSIKPYTEYMTYFSLKDFEKNGHAGIQTRITVEGKQHFLCMFKSKSV